jgi:galactokinase/mevalonate kinase-like predicted kinase
MDNPSQDNNLAAQENDYNSRLLAIWSAKASESEPIIEHERQSRAKIDREGNNAEQMALLQQQAQARQQIIDDEYGQMEADLNSKWKIVEEGINGGMTWEKMDAMEKTGPVTSNGRQLL